MSHFEGVSGKCHLNIMKLWTNLSTFVFISVHAHVGQVVGRDGIHIRVMLNLESCHVM